MEFTRKVTVEGEGRKKTETVEEEEEEEEEEEGKTEMAVDSGSEVVAEGKR
jgi:hypothetical protein